MKIATVVGARPQFIKAAAVSRILRDFHSEILIHSGQHYDQNMSDVFFNELSIPKPDYNLGVGSGSHARQTADMLVGIEDVLFKEKPDLLMVYGDTNSTLAAALAASKIHIPIAHVEAGLRSFNMKMPEEQNRILTDRISAFLFCPTDTAVLNLANEGIKDGVYNVGDVMCDAVVYYKNNLEKYSPEYFFSRLNGLFKKVAKTDNWYMTTIHRVENTPVHPRTKPLIKSLYDENIYRNILFVEPVGYLDMLYFTKNAIKVITDSGGLQKEAYILNTPCITIRDQTEWVETLIGSHNILCKPHSQDIIYKVKNTKADYSKKQNYYGNGDAASKISALL